jgi:hypothetical protein
MLSRVISNLAQRHLADSKEIAMCLMADKAAGSDQAKCDLAKCLFGL